MDCHAALINTQGSTGFWLVVRRQCNLPGKTMAIEDQINQHYDRKINLLQGQLDAVNQEMTALDSAHNAAKATLDRLLAKSQARAQAATEKRQKLQAEL